MRLCVRVCVYVVSDLFSLIFYSLFLIDSAIRENKGEVTRLKPRMHIYMFSPTVMWLRPPLAEHEKEYSDT